MDKNKITIILTSIKERFLNNPLFSKAISIVLSVGILSLIIYYCINVPWLSLLSGWRPDTKQLITETLKFHWVPVFLSRFPYVFYALILNFIALFIGNRILRWLKVDFDSSINKIIFAVPLGWSIYSIGIFYLGISGLLYKEAVYCFLTLLGVLSILEIERFSKEWKASTITSSFKIEKGDFVFLPVIIAFIAVQLVASFSPVWSIDSLTYHMGLPRLYVKHHALVHVPGFFFSTFPAHTEMLYLLGIITSDETLSKLFSFIISSMFLITIFSIGNRYFSKGAGYLAAITLLLISPSFSIYYSEPLVDIALAVFSLLGAYAFFMWMEEKKDGYIYLSIINCAFAAATKIQGLFFVLLFFAGFLVTVKKDKQFLKKLAWCILAVSTIALPWYIRSWYLAGDPVFPFLYKYLGAKYWNEYANECFWEFTAMFGGAKSFNDFIRINKDLLSLGTLAHSPSSVVIIFWLIALLTLKNRHKLVTYLFFITLIYYIFFLFTSPQPRFIYVGYASMCIISAYFIKMIWEKHRLTRPAIILCIITFFVLLFFKTVGQIEGPFFAGLGVIDKGQFYAFQREFNIYRGPYYKVSIWVNENLPQDSKILTWQPNGYHIERAYLCVNPVDLDFGKITDASTFLKNIKELGITHLIYEPNPGLPKSPKRFLNKYVFELSESSKITQLKQIDPFVIYSVVAFEDE